MDVALLSSSRNMLSPTKARCGIKTNAIPKSGFRDLSSVIHESSPPAEEPMPMMGKEAGGRGEGAEAMLAFGCFRTGGFAGFLINCLARFSLLRNVRR